MTEGVNAVSAVAVEGRHLVINVDASDGTIQIWDPATGRPAAEPLATGTGWRTTGAALVIDGRTHVITGDADGKLLLLRRRRRLVPRGEFAAISRAAPDLSLDAFRADQDATAEQEPDDP